MRESWKDHIYRQRKRLAETLRMPLAQLGLRCAPAWGDRVRLNSVLTNGLPGIPYCSCLYLLGTDGIQVSDNVGPDGPVPGHCGRDRSQRPYMKEQMPEWGFLLSDAYISILTHRPALTALQVIRSEEGLLGYLGADFPLRDLPVTFESYEEPGNWQQVKGDQAIRNTLFQQTRVESRMDGNLEQSLSILEELLTERGVFQCDVHFSSSQAIVWLVDDPFRYRMLDHEALTDPDICLAYRCQSYPDAALIPRTAIAGILDTMKVLRLADETVYLRKGSINLFNGIVSLTFSCDGTHYMPYDELLRKEISFWFGQRGAAAACVPDAVPA